jgi:hypothetical protein
MGYAKLCKNHRSGTTILTANDGDKFAFYTVRYTVDLELHLSIKH